MDEIKKLLNEKQFNRALSKLSNLTDNSENIYLKAVCCRYLGDYHKTLNILEDYELNFPENARVYQERGYCYEQLNQIPQAIFNFQKAIHLNDALISSVLSIIKYEKHLSSDEYQYYQYLIRYLKSLPPELLSSQSFLNQGMYLRAERLCKSFMQKHKLNIDGMVVLSKIARAMKIYDQAEFLLETALETNKKHHEANYEYVRVLQARQKYSLALMKSGEMVSIFPNSKKHLRLHAISLTGFEQFNEAIKVYDKILQKDPNSYDIYHNLGHLYKTLGSFESSANNYRKALAINPFFGDAYWSLANLKNANFSTKEIAHMEHALNQPLAEKDMIEIMPSGSVIYDLAASQGGNSELTKVDEIVEFNGVRIMGEANILNKLPVSASNLYAKNMFNFVSNLFDKEKKVFNINLEDEIIEKTKVK